MSKVNILIEKGKVEKWVRGAFSFLTAVLAFVFTVKVK